MEIERVMEVLACPKCKGDLELKKDQNVILCHGCRLRYPIVDGIPDMLIEDAEKF